MSRVDQLIRELSPHGVEFKQIGAVAECTAGATPASGVAAYWENGTIPWMSSGEVNKGIVRDTDKRITQAGYDSCSTKMLPPNIVVVALAGQGKTRGLVARTRIALCTNQSLAAIVPTDSVDSDYLYYYLQTQYQNLRSASAGDGGRGGLNLQIIRGYRIPVPPIEVQREIVRVLDSFSHLETELEAELGTEIETRRRQYNYCRDALLISGNANCEWLTLGEAATEFGRGKSKHRPRNDPNLYGGRYPFIQTGDIRSSSHLITEYSQTYNEVGLAQSKLWPRGTICITIAANIAETGILDFAACFPDSVIGMVVNPERASQFFVEYLLQAFRATLAAKGHGSAQANINLATFENERFPFPPLKEQERIVSILDELEASVNELSIGLRAELDGRRKQYDYYRDKLLTFEKAAV